MEDILQKLLDKQKELDERIIKERCNNVPPEIQDFCRAMIHEAVELENLTSWKWWKKPPERNKEKMKEELIDVLHFWMSISNQLGMSAKEIEEIYMKKNKVNHERQDNGY